MSTYPAQKLVQIVIDGKGTSPVNLYDMSTASGSWMYFAKHLYPRCMTKAAHPKNKVKERIIGQIVSFWKQLASPFVILLHVMLEQEFKQHSLPHWVFIWTWISNKQLPSWRGLLLSIFYLSLFVLLRGVLVHLQKALT